MSNDNVGLSRRYECSLSNQQRRELELQILDRYKHGGIDDLDPKLDQVKEDLLIRGYLRTGLPIDSLKTRNGRTLKTTVEGEKYIRSRM